MHPVDCLILDRALPDIDAFLDEASRDPALEDRPLLVYGEGSGDSRSLAGAANVHLVQSPERLLDQASLFLHYPVDHLPDSGRQTLEQLHHSDRVLAGKKVLIVDDDIRNIFALTSVLERHSMVIVPAETGREAIRRLQEERDIDIVLMDIMMPEMDGMDTMRAIRQLPGFKNLPIIAVTAKAMKGDREKCIEAGAWDYLSKPVDTDQMLTVLRGWLHR
jgi:CheY-like chemotaxis protein